MGSRKVPYTVQEQIVQGGLPFWKDQRRKTRSGICMHLLAKRKKEEREKEIGNMRKEIQ